MIWKAVDIDPDKLITELEEISEYEGWFDVNEGYIYIDAKWYEYDDNMIEVSKNNKDVLFIVDGDGEESGDIWRKFYKNGKSADVTPSIMYPEFDESKLK